MSVSVNHLHEHHETAIYVLLGRAESRRTRKELRTAE
jgi:uncharacterized RmlC-like cupin family protein